MGCLTTSLKCLVVVCNLLLALIGIVLLVGGVALLTDGQKHIHSFFKDYSYFPRNFSGNITTASSSAGDRGGPDVDFRQLLQPIAIGFIVSGAIISVIAVVCVCGVCCNNHTLLTVFSIVVIVFIIAEILLTVLFFVNLFDGNIKVKARETLAKHYVDIDDPGEHSRLWNYLMIEYSCCGVDGYEDFNSSLNWSRDREFSPSGIVLNATVLAPFACCKGIKEALQDIECVFSPTDKISNWKEGCWQKLEKLFEPYRVKAIGIVSAILIAEAFMVLIVIIVASNMRKTAKTY